MALPALVCRRHSQFGDQSESGFTKWMRRFLAQEFNDAPLPSGNCPLLLMPHLDLESAVTSYITAYQALQLCDRPELLILIGNIHPNSVRAVYPNFPEKTEANLPVQFVNLEFTLAGDRKLLTDSELIMRVHQTLGDQYFAGGAHLAKEHSFDSALAVTSMVWGNEHPAILPLVTAGWSRYSTDGGFDPGDVPEIARVVDLLKETLRQRTNCQIIVCQDLSHVGPMYGDEDLSQPVAGRVENYTSQYLEYLSQRDALGSFRYLGVDGSGMRERDPYRFDSATGAYLALRATEELSLSPGFLHHIGRAAIDEDGKDGLVGECLMTWQPAP